MIKFFILIVQVKHLSEKKDEKKGKELKGVRADVDELDDEELYYKYMEENPDAGILNFFVK